MSSDYSCAPILSNLLLQSCLLSFYFFWWRQAYHCSTPGLTHRRATDQLKAKKLFDWVLIWDCQTSRDDKVHIWEQGSSLLCIFCCNQLCRAKRCIHQSGITQPCHHCVELHSCGHQSCQNTCDKAATVMELSNLHYLITCCTSPLGKGICIS